MNQANALRAGYPDRPYRYLNPSEYSEEIQKKADESEGVMSSREEAIVLQSMIQRVVSALSGDGSITERAGKDGDLVEASDEKKITLLTRLTTAYANLAKLEFQITDDRYVPIEQVMTWIAAFVRIIEQKVPQGLYQEIIDEVKKVPQPKVGRKKK